MASKKALIIIAVAMMLIAASSAYAYTELWSGGCGTGTLTYNDDDYYYDHGDYNGNIRDTTKTAGQRDTFDLYTCTWEAVFYHWSGGIEHSGSIDDSLVITEYSWGVRGWKYTGTTGTKYGEGTFIAACTNKNFVFYGTWDNTTFDYTPHTPTASGDWDVTGTYPDQVDLEGDGTFELTRTYYSP